MLADPSGAPAIAPAMSHPLDDAPQALPPDVPLWAMACYLMAFPGLIVAGIGFTLGPLIA